MVNHSRRQLIAVKVRHPIRTHHHRAVLLVEGVNKLLHGVLVVVRVIAVQLDSKPPTLRMVQRHIPVAAYSVPRLILSYINQVLMPLGYDLLDGIYCAVLAVVIHHNHVELVRLSYFLAQRTADRRLYRAHPVLARNHHTRLVLKLAGTHIHILELRRQVSAYIFQVPRHGFLHLDLHTAVLGIDIVKQLLPGLPCIQFHIIVQVLVDMFQRTFLADFQPQVIESRILVGHIHPLHSLHQRRSAEQQYTAEIEVVTQGTHLVVYHRRVCPDTARLIEVVGIHHRRTAVFHQGFHALQGKQHKRQRRVLRINLGIRSVTLRSDSAHILRRTDIPFDIVHLCHKRLLAKVLHRWLYLLLRLKRNKTRDVFHISVSYNGLYCTNASMAS